LTGVNLSIRACRPEDVPAVLDLWARNRSEHASTTDRPEDLQRLLVEQPDSVHVALADDKLVGALIAAWDGWRGNMYRLAVVAPYRRRGVGLALVRAGERQLRERGARRITALVAHDDEDAAAFWERAGYPRDPVTGRRVRNL
jgi:ribosomal protein S18 acetylase RimI-like enzyme